MKKKISLLLVIILIMSSLNVSAISMTKNLNNQEIQREALSRVIHINRMLEPVGLTLGDIISLPDRETEFYEDIKDYLNSRKEQNIYEIQSETKNDLKGKEIPNYLDSEEFTDRYLYAKKMADKNLKIDSNASTIDKETTYMYLSHFIDIPTGIRRYVDPSSSYDGYFCFYITEDDRMTYDQYISIGKFGEAATEVENITTSIVGMDWGNLGHKFLENLKKTSDNIEDIYSFTGSDVLDIHNFRQDSKNYGSKLINLYSNKDKSGLEMCLELEQFIKQENVFNGLKQSTKDEISNFGLSILLDSIDRGWKQALKNAIGSGGNIGIFLALTTVDTVTLLYKDFYDYVTWLSLVKTTRGRVALRMMRAWGL